MFGTILKFMFTGKDNQSYELMRGLTALCVVVMLVYVGLHLLFNKQLDVLASCTGLGALLAGGGLGAAVKDGTLSKPTKVAGDLKAENIENVEVGKGE